MRFTKMQGAGNDYIYINCIEEIVTNPPELSVRLSDRHFGVGSDGIVLIYESEIADFKMRMYNSDGSESEMCGNAVRCIAKYVYEKGLTDKTEITLETLAGIKVLKLNVHQGFAESVTVNMGAPQLEPEQVPVLLSGDAVINRPVNVNNETYNITCVSMGNPHSIVFVEDVDSLKLSEIGPLFESHEIFPKRVNAEFAQVIDRNTIKMRVWERGTGETLACGTGACAVVAAAVLNGKCDEKTEVILPGGRLLIEWDRENNLIYKTGPAEFVFDGELL